MQQRSIPLHLTEIETSDKVPLAGVFADAPRKRTAMIWVHGLSSAFYHGLQLVEAFAQQCPQHNIGYFKFNNRGHDVIARGGNGLMGVAFEDFRRCVEDLRAMVRFVRARGYRRIILGGHSTGANKIVYYLSRTQDRRVKGIVLAGGVSDIAADWKHDGKKSIERVLQKARRLVAKRKPNEIVSISGRLYGARRLVSLYGPGEAEDTFPVYNPKARWTAMRKLTAPMLVVFGKRDEHMDRPAQQLIDLYEAKAIGVRQFTGIVIPNANHGFRGKEREMATEVIGWIERIQQQ